MFTTLTSTVPVFDLGATLGRLLEDAPCCSSADVERQSSFQPPVNIGESTEGYFIEVDLPGLKMEEIDVTVDGRQLTISGERKASEIENATYRRCECSTGRFERVFNLPESADATKVEASLSAGVLTVRIPKAETAKPRRINVQTG